MLLYNHRESKEPKKNKSMKEVIKMMDLVVMDVAEMMDVLFEMRMELAVVDVEEWDDLVEVLAEDGEIYVFDNIQAAFEWIVAQA